MINLLDDVSLINNIKTRNCSDSLSALEKRHSGIWYKVTVPYVMRIRPISKLVAEEIVDNKLNVLYDAVVKYNSDKKTKFSYWFYRCTDYFCKNATNIHSYFHKFESRRHTEIERDEETEKEMYWVEPSIGIKDQIELIYKYIDELSDSRFKTVMELRIFEEKHWQDIAPVIGVTYERARQIYEEGMEKLRKRVLKSKEFTI